MTSDTARTQGLRVDREADPHTLDGLVTALVDALQAGIAKPGAGPGTGAK